MPPEVGGATRVLALLGNPVARSLSPRLHNAAIAAAGLDAVYVPLRCEAQRVEGLVRGLAGADGGGNVTLPHKHAVAALLERPTGAVSRTGACNTFWAEDGRLCGDNTDVAGFRRALDGFLGGAVPDRVLLLGAGGAAAAVLVALLDAGVDQVTVSNRTPGRAHALVGRVGQRGAARALVAESADQLRGHDYDLAINATRLGLDPGDPPPLRLGGDVGVRAVYDLVYAPGASGTAWVRSAEVQGLPATDGRDMLVQQAALAFERWWGRDAPIAAMRAALED